MVSIFKTRGNSLKKKFIFSIPLITAILITGVVFAQEGALLISVKPDQPTELIADGQTQTRLMMDLSDCAWYPGAGSEDLLQIQFTSSLGTTLSPPSVTGTIGEVGSPFEVVLKSGTQYGTALITATASFCTEGNLMTFGVCSSQQEQNNPKCTGVFEIAVRPSGSGSEEGETAGESEETGELSVSLSCPTDPTVGSAVVCKAVVSGAKQDESLDYLWSVDGETGPKTKDSTGTWVPKEVGYYQVSVEVFGQDRSARTTLRVNVLENPLESEASDEEEQAVDTSSSGSDEVSGLVSNLEGFLRSAGVKKIDLVRLAVAGTGVSALIVIWMITQHRSGVPMEKLEQALGKWRWREGEKAPKTLPESENEPPKTLPEKSAEKPPEKLPEEASDRKKNIGPVRECPSCGNDIPAGSIHCPLCKEKIGKVPEEVPEAEALSEKGPGDVDPSKECIACGEDRVAGVSDCPHCKEKYVNVSEKTPEAGTLLGSVSCPECGEDIKNAWRKKPPVTYDTDDMGYTKNIDSLKYCVFCGNAFIAGANFCHHCGSPQPKEG